MAWQTSPAFGLRKIQLCCLLQSFEKAEIFMLYPGIQMDIDGSKSGKGKSQPIALRGITFNAIILKILLKKRSTEDLRLKVSLNSSESL
jgi:hypothetical protein